jgi:[ribosomal protein S5]-alanine N-acetyltransferase
VPPAPDRIETDRLVLRRPVDSDAEAIFARYASDPDVTRFLGWPRHASVDDTRAFLAFSARDWSQWAVGPYLVERREDGLLIGSTGLAVETHERAATGYVFARDAWGQGYATEALQAMVALAPTIGVRRLYALCHPMHDASRHVLEKCGFEREGVLRRYAEFPNLAVGEPADVVCFSYVF